MATDESGALFGAAAGNAAAAAADAAPAAKRQKANDKDKRMMFDQAMEVIADDVGRKVGEMERFMEISDNFMESIDLQNGVFEEKGLQMLEKWEKEGTSFLLGEEKDTIIKEVEHDNITIDLDAPVQTKKERQQGQKGQYSDLFDF